MKPIKLSVVALSRSDCSLLSGDVAIKCMLEKLSRLGTNISMNILVKLNERIETRTNKEVMFFLECLRSIKKKPTKATISFAQSCLTRLFNAVTLEENNAYIRIVIMERMNIDSK